MKSKINYVQLGSLIFFLILALVFWNSFIMYPVKIFVVVLHELSHGIMAILCGGKIVSIEINPQLSGLCVSLIPQNFWAQILVATSGYLGSLVWGAILLILSYKMKNVRVITLFLGIILFITSFFTLKAFNIFGFLYCLIFGILMVLAYKKLNNDFHEFFIKFVALTSSLYVIFDIKSDLIDHVSYISDATKVSQLTMIPSVVVGGVWLIISIFVLYFVFRYILRTDTGIRDTSI